jgi:hypothetical protein
MLSFDQRFGRIIISNPIEKSGHGRGGCRHPSKIWYVVI